MLRSFLTITFRILWRNKVTSFVNIFSLSVGIAVFIFIALYVLHEASYDKFHQKYNRIYRLEADDYSKLPPRIGQQLKDNLAEVENAAFFSMDEKSYISFDPEDKPELRREIAVSKVYADSTTFSVFSFSFKKGNPRNALAEPETCVLTESAAAKLFEDIDPIGQSVKFEGRPFRVTGIIEDVKQSHIDIEMLLSRSSYANSEFVKSHPRFNQDNVMNSSTWSATYLLAVPGVSRIELEGKINKQLEGLTDMELFNTEFKQFHLRPLSELYMNGVTPRLSYGRHGNLKNIIVLAFIGIFLLILAVVNYVNLTTARSATRSKEIAIKRFTGSSGRLVQLQLIGESLITTVIASVMAFTLVQFYVHKFNELVGINVELSAWNRPTIWIALVASIGLLGLLAGIYPAIYLTSKSPVSLIKGRSQNGSDNGFRNMLTVFQFAMSMVMIVAVLINFRQLNFLRNSDFGFSKAQVLTFNTPGSDETANALRETFRQRVLLQAGVENISYCNGIPGFPNIMELPPAEANGVKSNLKSILVDENYINVMGMKLVAGTNFTTTNAPIDRKRHDVLVNEMVAREFGLDDPVGQDIRAADSSGRYLKIIGVIRDFHVTSLHHKIEPLVLLNFGSSNYLACVKISSSNIGRTIEAIQQEYKNVWGDHRFEYTFLDDRFDRQYKSDEQLAEVIGYFTGIAIIIACLGLFALSSFMVSRRVKEIGVRKVLGASVSTIYSMLSWDFLKWILVAIVVASPVAWFLMKMWLSTFAYHIELGIDIFVMAALIAIGIALLTVTGQTLRVARANPVDSLKYE